LNKALRQLQGQLNGIQRGTAAWDAHIAKIRLLKSELAKVNATMATQQSKWTIFNNWLNNASTAIMGIAAAVTGLVMAGRKAVNAYAEMEEQMANTRKYTRMTEADVLELNEAFKNMDTRLAREQLNLLAQEGGRLGYNTIQSVKEYVEAASIINVALVDLGEGATQTIAKLSTIFGMEEMYGVKEAMLKIGSTVNHLSQNCTALSGELRPTFGRYRCNRQNDHPRNPCFWCHTRRSWSEGRNVGNCSATCHHEAFPIA
jgi:hypothetical protein